MKTTQLERGTKLTWLLFAVYILLLTWIIVFKMAFSAQDLPEIRNINLVPFGESVIVNNELDIQELLYNMIAFVPVGIYLSMLTKWSFLKRAATIAAISLVYELLQYMFAIGASDITDLINNTLGGVIGIGLYHLLLKLARTKFRADKIINILAAIGTIGLILFMSLIFIVNGF
ncbi:VanZ family protein [Paenibacillus urinalis]|uniref:VanZ family protein n=1 Tax=Paenibacillus urinalis TaxID=521520 RepID=UPI00195F9B47|nr:VanZ family protein [Paenibacillus urinalis]WDH95426.1 VanZ family protein [Paenibacillus urinalis]